MNGRSMLDQAKNTGCSRGAVGGIDTFEFRPVSRGNASASELNASMPREQLAACRDMTSRNEAIGVRLIENSLRGADKGKDRLDVHN